MMDKSPGWHAEFIDGLPAGIYRTTVEGRLVFCNRGFARIFGFDSVGELIGYPVINFYHDKMNRGHLINEIMARGYVDEMCFPFKKRGGISIWCSITARGVVDDEGTTIFIDGVMRDVTEEMEEVEPGLRLDEIVNAMDDLIIVFDISGRLLDVNRAGAELFGYPKEELLGKALSEFIVPRDRELLSLFLAGILETGREEGILTVSAGNGPERHLELDAYLARKKGNPHHIKCIARDITERLKEQKERVIKKKFEGILEMAGGIAHRLNQPLTIINNTFNEVLCDLPVDDRNREKLMRINNQIEKLNEIARKIRDINKYEPMDYVGGIRIVDIDKASLDC